MELVLRGRLALAAADECANVYSLALCERLPNGTRDDSASQLLKKMPPHMEIAEDPNLPTYLSLPYELMIPREKAIADFESWQLGRHGDEDGVVCVARFSYPTRGSAGTANRQAYWQQELSRLAGRWVEAKVLCHRYNFEVGGVRRVGTKLVLRYAVELSEPGHKADGK